MKTCLFSLAILMLIQLGGCASSSVTVPVDDRTAVPEVAAVQQEATMSDDITDSSTLDSASPQPDVEQATATAQKEAEHQKGLEQPEPIVLAMINKAELQMTEGEVDQAIASLERGARLKPKDPWLWHSLAVLRLRTKEWREAVSLAEKSISLSSNNQALLAGNWQVIAKAKKALGDVDGLKEAERMLRQYQQHTVS